MPAPDLQAWKDALKPLARLERSWIETIAHAAGALAAGEALFAVSGRRGRTGVWFAILLASTAAAKVVVVGQYLTLSSLLGFAGGYLAWLAVRARSESGRAALIVSALLAAYTLRGLAPFALGEARPVNWLPFGGLLHGSMLDNVKALAADAFLFMAVLDAVRRAGGRVGAAAIALAIWAGLVEVLQTQLAGRGPDVTAPILALLCGQAVRFWPERKLSSAPEPSAPARAGSPASHLGARSGWPPWLVKLGLACLAIAVPIAVVVRLPGIPYNVAELFLWRGSLPGLLVFALALLWTGAGPVWVAHHVRSPGRDWMIPPLAFAAGLVSLALLYASVTDESIGDIAGSNNSTGSSRTRMSGVRGPGTCSCDCRRRTSCRHSSDRSASLHCTDRWLPSRPCSSPLRMPGARCPCGEARSGSSPSCRGSGCARRSHSTGPRPTT